MTGTCGLIKTASLERVMDGLSEGEKYNAVLQGVSGIVMSKKGGGSAARTAFEEVFQLLDEMHSNRIKCTIRTASAVVDAATATTSVSIISQGAILERAERIAHSCEHMLVLVWYSD